MLQDDRVPHATVGHLFAHLLKASEATPTARRFMIRAIREATPFGGQTDNPADLPLGQSLSSQLQQQLIRHREPPPAALPNGLAPGGKPLPG
jgi:hypothetical protein